MKTVLSMLALSLILIASGSASAQSGSDYYMPMQVGSYLRFHSNGPSNGWAARTTTYTFEGTDSISGVVCFRERGREVADDSSFDHTFLERWLCKDVNGNVLIAAIGETSTNLDSAIILPAPSPFFINAALLPGYSVTYPYSNYFMNDSTLSDSETVTVPAGTFRDCVLRAETHYDSAGQRIFLEYHYFARGVGMVRNQRTIPQPDAHIDELDAYSLATSVRGTNALNVPSEYSLSQNYPNPFNPSTTIEYYVPKQSRVKIAVYDILGREVAILVDEMKNAGSYQASWDASRYASGVYFCRLQTESYSSVRKLLLMK